MNCMFQNIEENIKKIASFLGHSVSDKDVKMIAEYCCFSQMKQNTATNYTWWSDLGISKKDEPPFMRKGRTWDRYNILFLQKHKCVLRSKIISAIIYTIL